MELSLLGSANWSDFQGLPAYDALNGSHIFFGMPLSKNFKVINDRAIALKPSRHFLSVAPTRSGKGVSLIIPNLLLWRGPAIVIDPKGENAWATAKFRRRYLHQQTFILDPWGEINRRYGDKAQERESVSCFNPFSILNPVSPNFADDIAYLADALIINQGKDPFWDDSAKELVSGLIAFLTEKPEFRQAASLPALRLLLSKPLSELAAIAANARDLGHNSIAARKLGRFSEAAKDSKENASILSTALTQTAFLDSAALAQNLRQTDFPFEQLLLDQTTIYLVLPVDKLQTHGRWLRLLLSVAIRTIARSSRSLPLPVLFFLDEFGTIGRLNAVSQAYGLMAGLQMILWAFVQDLVQLKRDYPAEWETFVANSAAVTFLNVMDQFTAKYLSDLCGVSTVERISQQTADARRGGLFSSADPNFSRLSDQVFSRPLVTPDELRRITSTLGVMIWPEQPLLFLPIKYFQENFFLVRVRCDPRFPQTRKRQFNAYASLVVPLALPDWQTAVASLQAQGWTVSRSWLGKIKVSNKSRTHEFRNYDDLLQCARQQLAEYIIMHNLGESYAKTALTQTKPAPPPGVWFLPRPRK